MSAIETAEPGSQPPATRGHHLRRFGRWVRDVGPAVALVLLVVLGIALNPSFLSWGNLSNVLTRSAFIGIISIGATFVIVTGGIDLSVGAMAALVASLMIIIMNRLTQTGWAAPTAVAVGIVAGVLFGFLAGLTNGLLTAKGKIDSFIVTLGTMGIFRSLVTFLASGGTLTLNSTVREAYRPVYYNEWLNLPIPVWVLALVVVAGTIVLTKTRFGRYCRAVGSNPDVALYSAIEVNRIRIAAFVVQGFCVALATLLYVPRLGSASAQTGLGWELEAITAVVVGGTALRGGSGRIWGSIAGALILTLIGNLLNLTSIISVYLNGAVQGVIILGAALLQRGSRSR
ncbi:MAG: ABC transporter permease [Verrucomicrobia bacterium]|nr:ABC transporter permease [Verrucomicrobiota bacterium]